MTVFKARNRKERGKFLGGFCKEAGQSPEKPLQTDSDDSDVVRVFWEISAPKCIEKILRCSNPVYREETENDETP